MDLGMRVILAHGDEVIADSAESSFEAACSTFKKWIRKTYFGEEVATAA